ncbi:hypothetical protein [Rhizobium sp. L245/93]|uniref:hypothetical protein n=1 Tax=Rhizobium sp. L245/93 TaxID=2819998 RepID=UPI001ADC43C4|nr:hypothetical protein [Rhizobium sp. L245/93]MBO9168356.1 hypothetical protein [Rhizobium sp. L245/93]
MLKKILASGLCLLAVGCARSSSMRVSQNEVIINTSAAPACGSTGAAKVAQKQAAIETIKDGYDRYIIVGASAANNVSATQLPGTYQTFGTVNSYGGYGTLNATTTYQPGPVVFSGTHDQSVGIRMFKDGQPGSDQAISAREILGPKWAEIVKDGVMTCT